MALALTRREFLAASAATLPALASMTARAIEPASGDRQPLGVVINSYTQRVAALKGAGGPDRFDDALRYAGDQADAAARPAQRAVWGDLLGQTR